MKKIINNPDRALQEMVEGIAAAYPNDVKQLPENNSNRQERCTCV